MISSIIVRKIQFKKPLTSPKARPSAKSTLRHKLPMHDTGPDQFQEQVQGVLELVINPGVLDRAGHRTRQRRMGMVVQEESVRPKPYQESQSRSEGRRNKPLAHPLNSRNRQMTFATTSSFFSRGAEGPALIFVLIANRSVAVAPSANAKSIVDD
jgi:hypothetical protein